VDLPAFPAFPQPSWRIEKDRLKSQGETFLLLRRNGGKGSLGTGKLSLWSLFAADVVYYFKQMFVIQMRTSKERLHVMLLMV